MEVVVYFDVVIQGAGLVGSLFALNLQKSNPNLKVLILDYNSLLSGWHPREDYELRISAFNLSSIEYFKKIDIWDDLKDDRHGTFKKIQVFAADSNLNFNCNELNRPALAYTFENTLVLSKMHKMMDNIKFMRGFVETIVQTSDRVDITLGSGKKISTSLLVGADGANSSIRRKLSMPVSFTAYEQKAIIGNFKAKASVDTAFQTFSKYGILAWLPLGSDRFSIVLSCPSDVADTLQTLKDSEFIENLSIYDCSEVSSIESISNRVSINLQGVHAEKYTSGRVALLGDAAHVIHPLAGQGVNIGFKDSYSLSTLLANTSDIPSALIEYQRNRQISNSAMQKLMESLNYSFVKNSGFTFLKNNLMKFAENNNFLKQQMLDFAI